MQSMMNHKGTMSARSRWMRGLAAVAIAASGVTAACLIQVQPTFAAQQAPATHTPVDVQLEQQPMQVITDDHAPALVSGHSAQKQLRNASRRLHEAEANATTDEDRNKIATAQQMLRMAQSELAQQSVPQPMVVRVLPQPRVKALAPLDLQLKQLDDQVFQIRLDEQQMHVKVLQLDQQKKLVAQQKQAVDRIRVQVDAQIRDQVRQTQRIAKDAVLIAKIEPPVVLVEAQEAPMIARISSGIMAGQIVSKVQPVYPKSAKDAKISGAVVLHAIINETGKVEKLTIISSPDKDLSVSAIEAVQQWVYKPYLVNGRPTAVDTTITVNYSFAG